MVRSLHQHLVTEHSVPERSHDLGVPSDRSTNAVSAASLVSEDSATGVGGLPNGTPYHGHQRHPDCRRCSAGLHWLLCFWQYFDSRISGLRYLIAASSFYGGILFAIGAFAAAIPQVADRRQGGFDAFAWLVITTFFVGSYVFTAGCILLSVEAVNRDYPDALDAWREGRASSEPRFKLLWLAPDTLGWWGSVSYIFGALLYNVGTTTTFASCFTSTELDAQQTRHLELLPFMAGGVFFCISGLLYIVEFSGNPLRGMVPWQLFGGLPPEGKLEDIKTFTWWVNFCNLWGGVGFCMSGFWGYRINDIPVWEYRIQNAIGFGVGALLFMAAGLLLFIQMSLARCASCEIAGAEEDMLGSELLAAQYKVSFKGPSVSMKAEEQQPLLDSACE